MGLTPLPPALEREALELTEHFNLEYPADKIADGESFVEGVRWLWARVSESAPEFDGEAHMKWLESERAKGLEPSPQANARWQHSQDAAVIGALKAEVEQEVIAYSIVEGNWADLKDELAQANARIAELEHYALLVEDFRLKKMHERIQELEAALEATFLTVEKDYPFIREIVSRRDHQRKELSK